MNPPATLANWRTAPFNRWAFHHVRELIPTADIPNDPRRIPFQWRYAERDDFHWVTRSRKVRQRIDDAAARGKYLFISHGQPIEVKPGIFVSVEPCPLEGLERKYFIAEWRRREEEAAASGEPWFPPRYVFNAKGKILKLLG